MQYSLLIYQTESQFAARTDLARRDANGAAFMKFVGAMHEARVLVTTLGIEPPHMTATVRPDGVRREPLAGMKEQFGGLCVIDVPDIDAAIAWAKRAPFDHCHAVEVRPTRVVPAE
jgi:hypothetical protein